MLTEVRNLALFKSTSLPCYEFLSLFPTSDIGTSVSLMYIGAIIFDQRIEMTSPRNGMARNIVLNGATFHIPVKMKNDSFPITNSGGLAL